jgi:hypothetical protein
MSVLESLSAKYVASKADAVPVERRGVEQLRARLVEHEPAVDEKHLVGAVEAGIGNVLERLRGHVVDVAGARAVDDDRDAAGSVVADGHLARR